VIGWVVFGVKKMGSTDETAVKEQSAMAIFSSHPASISQARLTSHPFSQVGDPWR